MSYKGAEQEPLLAGGATPSAPPPQYPHGTAAQAEQPPPYSPAQAYPSLPPQPSYPSYPPQTYQPRVQQGYQAQASVVTTTTTTTAAPVVTAVNGETLRARLANPRDTRARIALRRLRLSVGFAFVALVFMAAAIGNPMWIVADSGEAELGLFQVNHNGDSTPATEYFCDTLLGGSPTVCASALTTRGLTFLFLLLCIIGIALVVRGIRFLTAAIVFRVAALCGAIAIFLFCFGVWHNGQDTEFGGTHLGASLFLCLAANLFAWLAAASVRRAYWALSLNGPRRLILF